MRRICVIANPASGRGRGSRIIPRIQSLLSESGAGELRTTSARGDERAVVARALDDGFDTLVALGGDGTWSNVANAILDSGDASSVRLGLLAAGTGNDFAKTIGAPVHDARETIRLAVDGPDVAVDVGRIENLDTIRWLTGPALYFCAGLREIFRYPGFEVDLESESGDRIRGRQLIVIIANAKNFGGVFQLAPQASAVDGQLDAIAIGNAQPTRRLRLFVAAARAAHLGEAEVRTSRSPVYRLRFDTPPAYETDGEYNVARSRELEITCVSRALRIVTPVDEGRL